MTRRRNMKENDMHFNAPHPARSLASTTLASLALAGATLAGDFNGDGFDDLAIGASGESLNGIRGGVVHVLYGSSGGVNVNNPPDQTFNQDSPNMPGVPEGGDEFGGSFVAGDFNGDGCDDLAIGIPGEDFPFGGVERTDAGFITVIFGRPTVGLQTTQSGFLPMELKSSDPSAGMAFGSIMAAGDFNNDGFDDLAVGAPGEAVGAVPSAGRVHVVYGSTIGLNVQGRQIWTQNSSGIDDQSENRDFFGSALAASDLSGDAADELAVGVPGEDNSDSVQFLIFGTGRGIVQVIGGFAGFGLGSAGDLTLRQGFNGLPGSTGSGDQFGGALGALPGARSGLAIGCRNDNDTNASSGSVTYIPYGLSLSKTVFISQNNLSGFGAPTQDDDFGASVIVSDFGSLTPSGAFLDLAIGAPGAAGRVGSSPVPLAGAVFVLHGKGTVSFDFAAARRFCQGQAGLPDAAESNDKFGRILQAGNFGKDLVQDLVVGVPLEDTAVVDTGLVHVLYGSISSGLGTTGTQLWSQDSTGIDPETAEFGDKFGSAVSGR